MRGLLILAVAVIPAVAQNPVVHLTNATHPASREFQAGDRFEILITGAANQSISVRTTMRGRTDWGPIIGWTNTSGRWSTSGQFEKGDFGDWSEVWTVGGKVANPALHFSVGAPCLKGDRVSQRAPASTWSSVARPRTDARRLERRPTANLSARRMAEWSVGGFDRT